MLPYVLEKWWIVFRTLNEILYRRNDIKLCISEENGYRHRKTIILNQAKNKYMLKRWSQQPMKGQKSFRIKMYVELGGPRWSDRALAVESTDRLTQRQFDDCQHDCWELCQRAKGWDYHPAPGILVLVFEAFSLILHPIFLFGSKASRIHRFF